MSHRLKLVRDHYISKPSFNIFLSSLGFQIKLEQVIVRLVQLVMFETFKLLKGVLGSLVFSFSFSTF